MWWFRLQSRHGWSKPVTAGYRTCKGWRVESWTIIHEVNNVVGITSMFNVSIVHGIITNRGAFGNIEAGIEQRRWLIRIQQPFSPGIKLNKVFYSDEW